MVKKKINIHIGGIHAAIDPTIIETLLGSCVAACLFDPSTRIGGMNHILLPEKPDIKVFDASTRYGINAMELLINRIMILGGRRPNIVAKVFGGSRLFPSISKEKGTGRKNTQFVLDFLRTEKIKVISKNTGGHDTRRIYFHTDTGEVFLKRTRSTHYSKIITEEREYLERCTANIKIPGDVTLFR
jgi:chemotaxis protein CheD